MRAFIDLFHKEEPIEDVQPLIQNATMLLPETTVVEDLLIENGYFAIQPGGGLVASDDVRTIDATGLHLLPGLIDPQVHFRDLGNLRRRPLYRIVCNCKWRNHFLPRHAQQRSQSNNASIDARENCYRKSTMCHKFWFLHRCNRIKR